MGNEKKKKKNHVKKLNKILTVFYETVKYAWGKVR